MLPCIYNFKILNDFCKKFTKLLMFYLQLIISNFITHAIVYD